MIDMHNHVLYGVDDGAQTIEDSVEMLAAASAAGFSTVVLTPHYMVDKGYTSPVRENRTRVSALKKAARDAGIAVELILGSELLYEFRLVERIGSGVFTTLGESPYYLVETDRHGGTALGIQNFMAKLEAGGHRTIFAHPERYDFVQEDPDILLDFIARGTLIQGNYLSLTGYYGSTIRDTLVAMLEHGMVSLMGSDAHQPEGYDLYAEAAEVGASVVGAQGWRTIMEDNPRKVLFTDETIAVSPVPFRPKVTAGVIGRFGL